MNLGFLGGAMEIGGSSIYLRIAGKGILMDAGIRQSGGRDPIPDFQMVQQMGGLDAIIISHAHMDHIGTLPIISKAYPNVPIYMTAMTADLTRVLLYDSLKIMDRREEEIPCYTEKDVLAMQSRVRTLGFNTPRDIFQEMKLTFYPAGHIAGAACVYLVTEEGSLFYSGDFSAFSQRTIEGIQIPKLRPDVSIVETTYGNRLHANRQAEEKRLVALVGECLHKKQKILIPAFALGRAQEVLLILRSAIQNGELPSVPVYVDGMIRDINIMYTRNPTYLKNALGKRILKGNEPFYTKEIQAVAPTADRNELLAGADPAIFVSSSGMLTGGPSVLYAKKLVSMENASIIITGYQDEEAPGRQLLDLLENPEEGKITLDGSTIPVKCGIYQVGLSAHGDKLEITSLLDRLSSRHVFLVHGNPDAIGELGTELAQGDYRVNIYLPECGQSYELALRKKRKQAVQEFPYTMQKKQPFTADDEEILWKYWMEHYPEKVFPISRIAQIWYGKPISDEEELQRMQAIFLKSTWFSTTPRRLFLFQPNSEEEIQKNAVRELTVQELEKQIQEEFAEFPYKKISYHVGDKEAVLNFDYPDSQDTAGFQKAADGFKERTDWNIRMNAAMNHQAAGTLLYSWFGDRLLKTSYYPERKTYFLTLSQTEENDRARMDEFQKETGWGLLINGMSGTASDSSAAKEQKKEMAEDYFLPQREDVEQVEQNLALSCIDQAFEEESCIIYRKSIKYDSDGKYLELSFISPAVGQRKGKKLQALATQIGWRLRIADKVNQAELFKIATMLCGKYGIDMCRNPSYLPLKREILLTVVAGYEEKNLQGLAEEFFARTECGCSFKIIGS